MDMTMTTFETYRLVCCNFLKNDNPEGIDTVFSLLRDMHPEFYPFFLAQYPGWVHSNFFESALSGYYSETLLIDWALQESDWQERLRVALRTGRSGPVARAMLASIVKFAKERATKVSIRGQL